MITLTNSSMNGWFFESMKNGVGTGKCLECGATIEVTSFNQANNLKPHDCDKTETQPTTK